MMRLATDLLDALDPTELMRRSGFVSDVWQRAVLQSQAPRQLWCCARQTGKSLTAAARAVHEALFRRGALVLLLSPSLRQSSELFKKVLQVFNALGRPVPVAYKSTLRIELTTGSRIVSLPESEETIRGFSNVSLLVIDEAARVSDELYLSTRPMLATSGGKLVALSTPYGARGWFHQEWTQGAGWTRTEVHADQCPRISAQFLAEERVHLGDRWFRQEYLCSFEAAVDQVFSPEAVDAALRSDLSPLFSA
jgi:hypothetical protein